MKVGVLVRLTEQERELIRLQVAGRNDPKRMAGVLDRRFDRSNSSEWVNALGLAGEIAAERYTGGRMNRGFSLSGDDGTDLHLPDGRTAAVRTSFHPRGHLLFNSLEEFVAGLAILAVLENGAIRLVGYIERGDFLHEHQVMDFGYGRRFVVSQNQLRDIRDLEA